MEKTAVTVIQTASLAGGASTTLADCTALNLSRAITSFFELETTFDTSATAGLSIKYYCSYDNVNYDTDAWLTDSIAVSAGNSVRIPLNPISTSPLYLKAVITNDDATYAAANIKLIATVMSV